MEGRNAALLAAAPGRERELDLLASTHQTSRAQGIPAFARVHGPAGIGKSHLLRALARRLVGEGVPVIAVGSDRGRAEALGLVRELAGGLLDIASKRGTSPAEIASATSRLAPLLEGRGRRDEASPRPEEMLLEIADALADLLRICLPAGPVLILDDLDVADRGSLELLQYISALLLQPGSSQGCLVVFAYRDGAANAGLAGLVERVPGLQLPLAPLDVEGVRNFLARPDLAERLFEETSGDPSRLEAVFLRGPADLGARRLARLESQSRQLLLGAAVLGRAAGGPLLRRIAGIEERSGLLDRLVADGFLRLRVEGAHPLYAFVRDSDRASVLASVSPEELARWHTTAADALAEDGAGIEEIARHHLAGISRESAQIWAARAAEALAGRCAFDSAIEFYQAALDGAAPAVARDRHLGLARAYEATGDLIAALRHIGSSRRHASADERRTARSEAARLCVRIGKLSQARRLCERVLEGRTSFDPADPVAARAWVDLAEIRFLRADYEGAIAAAAEGIPRADGHPQLRIGLRNTRGKALLTTGRHQEASAAFRRNAEEADAAGLLREGMLARINEGVAHHRRGDRDRAIELYREGLAGGEDRSLAALALGNLAVLYHEVGDFELALEHYGSALAAFTLLRRGEGVAHQGINRARLLLFLGDAREARAGVLHARLEAKRLGNPYLVAQADLVCGEIDLAEGDVLVARQKLLAARDTFEELGSPRYRIEAEVAAIRASLAAGAFEEAAAALPQLQQDPAALASPDLEVELALLAAELALADGRAAEALPLLEGARGGLLARPRGVGGDTDLEAPWRLYDLFARCHDALGRRDAASAHRVRARALLDELQGRVPADWRACFAVAPQRARLLRQADPEISPARAGAMLQFGANPGQGPALVGQAPALQQLRKRLVPIGRSLAPVLVRGESGSGKELAAEALHAASPRAALPLVKVNCSAVNEEQLLAELFGTEGPAGGMVRRGRIEQAQGGTIFLDEIGDLPQRAQVGLLRLLEEKTIERVGGSDAIPVDTRLIAASSRNLEEGIATGSFRKDLYYRLKGVMLELPPLRSRREDIPALAAHFLARLRKEPLRFSQEALALLASWNWPGNIRELENLVGAVAIFAEGELIGLPAFEMQGDFVRAVRSSLTESLESSEQPTGRIDFYAMAQARGIGVRELGHELELQMIGRALLEARGNISEAARLVHMKRSRLSQIVNAEPELLTLVRSLS